MTELLILRLEGYLQSWGESAKWNYRATSAFPSKSAVIGLIACAMGIKRNDKQIVELSKKISIGVRADRKGALLEDYHTVQGMPDIYTAEGKKRTSSNTIVTEREYLCDASFLVVIGTDHKTIEEIKYAFENPVWTIYLGRKNCVPSRPVFERICTDYSDVKDAVMNYPSPDRSDQIRLFEVECPISEVSTYSRSDDLIGSRQFVRRKVWRGVIKEESNVSDKN